MSERPRPEEILSRTKQLDQTELAAPHSPDQIYRNHYGNQGNRRQYKDLYSREARVDMECMTKNSRSDPRGGENTD
jgi:hypothetical protein